MKDIKTSEIESKIEVEKVIKIARLVSVIGLVITICVLIWLILNSYLDLIPGLYLICMSPFYILLYFNYTKNFLNIAEEDSDKSIKQNKIGNKFFIQLFALTIITIFIGVLIIILTFDM